MTRNRPAILAVALIALAAIAAILLILALSADGDDSAPVPAGALSVDRVADDPREYAGREITVAGEVSVLTDRALTIGEDDLIVLSPTPEAPVFENSGYGVGETVYATGELRIVDAEQATDLIGDVSLLPSQFQGFDRQPVLLADEVVAAG